MNLLHANLNRLDVARRDLRDLKGLGPLVASSLRSDATAQGPRPLNHVDPYAPRLTYI